MYDIEFEYFKKFILGGKADFIVRNINSGNHLNYKVLKHIPKENEQIDETKEIYYVYFKSHKDIYLGNIIKYKDNKILYFFGAKKFDNNFSKELEIFVKLFYFIFRKNMYPISVQILYTGECSVCGRKLTNPDYIKIGIGSKCLSYT